MKSYIEIITKVLSQSFETEKKFYLIKLENFMTPKIYFEVCKSMGQYFELREIQFIAKLSKEKYEEWNSIDLYKEYINSLDENKWIEKNEHLTLWRNYSFTNSLKDAAIMLMGTENVEDQSGLAEFYTISPETIENYIGRDYIKLLNNYETFDDTSRAKINNVIDNIFRYVEKDLQKLSDFFDEYGDLQEIQLIDKIFTTLYEWWGIPNIYNGNKLPSKQIKDRKIDLIEKGYKFSRRIGLEVYQKDKKLDQLKERLDKYLNDTLEMSQIDSCEMGNYSNDYLRLRDDLINYLKGINIKDIKKDIFTVNFELINKLLKLSSKVKRENEKPEKITGDPFIGLSIPILLEINELDDIEKNDVSEIKIIVDKITLSRTRDSSTDEDESDDKHAKLVTKWYEFVYFLNGIENLITRQGITNRNGEEIHIKLVFSDKNDNEKYPFNCENTKDLVDAGILVSAKESEIKSKIAMTYVVSNEQKVISKSKYDWLISEQDSWIHVFNIFNDNKFNSFIKENYEFLPLGYSSKIDLLLNAKNEEEFCYYLSNVQCEYINILDCMDKNSKHYSPTYCLAKKFTSFIKSIRKNGLFRTMLESEEGTGLTNGYLKFVKHCTESLKNNKLEDKDINILSKCCLMQNDKEFYGKDITGAIIPIYHPVMFEKVMERYMYLSNAFKELFDEIFEYENMSEVRIKKACYRFDQLSTIVFSSSVLLGRNNAFVTSKQSFGFYNIYGYSDERNNYVSSDATYDEIDYEEDEKISLATSPISNYISYTVKEYLKTYPSKIDGFTISFIKPNNYSDIIAGLNDVLKKLRKELEYKIKVKLIIYTDDFRAVGSKYFSNWIESNFTEEDNVILESYIRLLKYDDNNLSMVDNYLDRTIEKTDIVFFNDIMKDKEVVPEYVRCITTKVIENRFPAVYLPVKSYEENYRRLNITQTQFECEYNQAQLMVYLREPNSSKADYRIVKKVGISDGDYLVLEKLHEKSNWVIILDENIDVDIINLTKNKIIGFSTGEGYFGELNSTISSRDNILQDLKVLIRKRLSNKFSSWSNSEVKHASETCLRKIKYLDGAQILKALNPDDDAINNFLAYLLTYELEKNCIENESSLITRKIVSLDAYSHLFDDLADVKVFDGYNYRPDLLVLELYRNEEENKYEISAKIIECKLGKL